MDLRSEQLADGIEKITLVGRMDSLGGHEIDLRLAALVATRKLLAVVDLSEVTYVASAVVGVLVWLNGMLKSRQGRLALTGVHWNVHELFEICGVGKLVSTYAHVEEAVGELGSTPSGGPR